ncbi:MAG: TonB-dependent receptor plug domain-containing protein, partial [Bacteroidales bacterium]|nr:TonB-dependent receptor plug domain-containing protein [Bacteroidales bacterium]
MIYTKNKILIAFISIISFCFIQNSYGQKESNKKVQKVTISAEVVDETGIPVIGAAILANEGATTVFTDESGMFTVEANKISFVLIEAMGFEDYVIDVKKSSSIKKVVLKKIPLFTGEKYMVNEAHGMKSPSRNIVGAITSISGEELIRYPDISLTHALQGQGMGLTAVMGTGGLSNSSSSFYLRGLHSGGYNGVIVIVDGIERPINDLMAEEIESIELLKDATAKIHYGARAANGVILVTTKHGEKFKRTANLSFSSGISLPTHYPEFLNSADYARLYNEARENDGLAPLYTDEDIKGYENSTGENDMFYPNVDYYDYFLRDYGTYTKVTGEFSGGNERAQYSLIFGYQNATGLESVGEDPKNNRFNVRGSLDIDINDYLTGNIGLATRMDYYERGIINHNSTFDYLSGIRPNEFPLVIDTNYVPVDSIGWYGLGASRE